MGACKMTTDPNNGRLLANRYQLVELVGKGSMGRVYQAKDMLLGGVTVAVKFLSQTILDQTKRDRFAREATICAVLGEKSIHIVRVRDYGVDEMEIPFYVMEFLQGKNLKNIIKQRPLSLPRFLSMSRQICLGLQCAHQGIIIDGILCPIIHRDIKPSNILVVQDSSLGELVKIFDFGIAKLQSDDTPSPSFMGTLAYSSPEQIEGKQLDNRSDIYSLGVMMFEMLTGEIPVMAETHSFAGWYKAHHYQPPKSFKSVNATLKLPSAIEDLVMSCLAKSPSDRPPSAADILETLETLEERFSKRRKPPQRFEEALSQTSVIAEPKQTLALSAEKICQQASWPKDKPLAEIVFPHLLPTSQEALPTLWIMLPKQEILNRHISTRYNQFLFLMSPHPMMLWITTLHNRPYGPRWLPCYLDLKTAFGQKITRLLAVTGSYHLLLFALEEPQRCINVMTSTIASPQCQLLQEWANTSQTLISVAGPTMSKTLLKQEFEKLKPKILMKLEGMHTESDLSG
jgi:serine/threonine-protein kinase